MEKFVTLAEAREILAARGMPMDPAWLRRKAAAGQIPGAENVGNKIWIVPREWANTYVKVKSGRPRKDSIAKSAKSEEKQSSGY